ncbi:MAG: DUF2894 domain-containing protein [Hydrogenophaga sp.]|nr:DUF2894 domain-containing protein [Hydrogenophaga sp.]
MSTPGQGQPALATPSAMAAVSSLREAGAQRLDPVRFRYLEALAQRLGSAPASVQPILAGKLQQALDAYPVLPAAGSATAVAPRAHAAGAASCAPLAELNRYLAEARRAAVRAGDAASGGRDAGAAEAAAAGDELLSARRFRETWSRIAAEEQVVRAVGRGPENAGPLNSHQLVLRTLALMRDLSPDYLRRFLAQADALLWLEKTQAKLPARPRAAAPRARTPRQKKPAG